MIIPSYGVADMSLASCIAEMKHPCDVYQLLETAYIQRGLGEVAIKMKIGEEETTLSLPSLDNLRTMRNEYQSKCFMAGGNVPSPRQSICIEFGDHVCRTCSRKHCTC